MAIECTPTEKGFRRLQALRWLYEGRSVEEVAALSHFSQRQVHRFMVAFNLAGLDGLIPGRSSGRSSSLAKEQVAEKVVPVIEEPSLRGKATGRPSICTAGSSRTSRLSWAVAPR